MMNLNWSTVKGKTFGQKWRSVKSMCEKAGRMSPYTMLRELIIRDPEAFKIDEGSMRPEHAAGPDSDEYEIVILMSASHFTTVRPTPRGVPNERRTFSTFLDAFSDVGDEDRVLIYGVCESGRATPLSSNLWKAYSTIVAAVAERDSQ